MNRRVQIFKFFNTESPIYIPETRLAFVIGGYRNGCNITLREPCDVAYCSSGDLCICDRGLKEVLMVTPDMVLFKRIRVPFVSHTLKPEIPSICHKFYPAAPQYNQPVLDPKTHLPYPHNAPTIDRTPVSVSVSSDGKIAVMYKRGGLIVYRPFKIYRVGTLCKLQVTFSFFFF